LTGFRLNADRNLFPDFSKTKTFFYKLVPFPELGMRMRQISRLEHVSSDGVPFFTTHTFPFDTLPLLESHLQPKFVIYNSGKKLEDSDNISFEFITQKFPFAKMMWSLYKAWSRAGRQMETDPVYNAPAPESPSDNSSDNY